jgi:eukaryotic-like serine/threonine-protein kinase
LYVFQSNLLAQPFDPGKGVLSGSPVPVAEQVRIDEGRQKASFSVSREGLLIFASGDGLSSSELVWVDRSGKILSKLGEPGDFRNPRLSPDERYLAVVLRTEGNQKHDVWIYELARGIRTRLTFTKDFVAIPTWMPDGKSIAYTDTALHLKRKSISGLGQEELLLESKAPIYPNSLSPNGNTLLYMNFTGGKGPRIWVADLKERKQKPLLNTNFTEAGAAFSRDGKWIVFNGEESGRAEIYVVPYPALDGKFQVSTSGGFQPLWGAGDREIFYVAPDGKMMVAKVQTGRSFVAETPKALFDTRILQITQTHLQYSVSGDGNRFLINTRIDDAEVVPLTLVQNWTTEVKRAELKR